MPNFRRRIGLTIFIIVLGLLIGTLAGELLSFVLPEGAVKTVLTHPLRVGLKPFMLDLKVLTINFGFMININLCGIIGVVILSYIMKWIY